MATTIQSLEVLSAQYEKFLAKKGDVYEVKSVIMNPEEVALVEKAERFNKRITSPFFMVMGVLSIAGGVWALLNGFIVPGLGMLICAVAVVAFGLSYLGGKPNEPKQKIVITGIVTGRKIFNRQFSKSYQITLSRKRDLFISQADYEKITLGDFVQYEALSETQDIKSSLIRLGHINDLMSDK